MAVLGPYYLSMSDRQRPFEAFGNDDRTTWLLGDFEPTYGYGIRISDISIWQTSPAPGDAWWGILRMKNDDLPWFCTELPKRVSVQVPVGGADDRKAAVTRWFNPRRRGEGVFSLGTDTDSWKHRFPNIDTRLRFGNTELINLNIKINYEVIGLIEEELIPQTWFYLSVPYEADYSSYIMIGFYLEVRPEQENGLINA